MIKSLIKKIPQINKLISEKDSLKEKNRQLQVENINQLKQLAELKERSTASDNKLKKINSPLNNTDYKISKSPLFSISSKDLEKNKASIDLLKSEPNSVLWFIPAFNHISYGGIYTILRTANMMAEKGMNVTLVIYSQSDSDVNFYSDLIGNSFDALDSATVITFNILNDNIESLPETDMGVCTLWNSAYMLLRYNQTKDKYYFIQDFEPMFFAAGSAYALVESTYRFGFKGIVNTPGLEESVKRQYGMKTVSFIPSIDDTNFYYKKSLKKDDDITRVFFYARPTKPRNAFALGKEVMIKLKAKYGDRIEIITAGAVWNEADYGLKNIVTNLGLLKDISEVGDLYRRCDVSFSFMLSKHPSYQPFELMASGVAYVTNTNEHNTWFLVDEKNCLVSEPSPELVFENVCRLIDDKKLRNKIVKGGFNSLPRQSWNQVMEDVWIKLSQLRNDTESK